MNDTNSPIFRKRYADLLKDANSIFDLEWLREETGSLLMKELKQKGDEAWKCYVTWEEKCQTDSQMFFASAFLKAYREELEQVKAIVNEGIDVALLFPCHIALPGLVALLFQLLHQQTARLLSQPLQVEDAVGILQQVGVTLTEDGRIRIVHGIISLPSQYLSLNHQVRYPRGRL